MSEINPHVLDGVLMDPTKLAQMKDAFLCSLKLEAVAAKLKSSKGRSFLTGNLERTWNASMS